jgi:hypothetical protein
MVKLNIRIIPIFEKFKCKSFEVLGFSKIYLG